MVPFALRHHLTISTQHQQQSHPPALHDRSQLQPSEADRWLCHDDFYRKPLDPLVAESASPTWDASRNFRCIARELPDASWATSKLRAQIMNPTRLNALWSTGHVPEAERLAISTQGIECRAQSKGSSGGTSTGRAAIPPSSTQVSSCFDSSNHHPSQSPLNAPSATQPPQPDPLAPHCAGHKTAAPVRPQPNSSPAGD